MKRKITLTILLILIGICTVLSISYAWYSVGVGNNTVQMSTSVDIPDCASVTLNTGTALNLTGDNAAPISDAKALSSTNYRYEFTVTNNCNTASNLKVAIAPATTSTMPVRAIKYALIEQSDSVPDIGNYLIDNGKKYLTNQIIEEVYAQTSLDVEVGYEILNSSLNANTSKNYYLYVWVDYYEGDITQSGQYNNTTMNTSFVGQLIVSDYAKNEGYITLSETVLSLADGSERQSSQENGGVYRVINPEVNVPSPTTYTKLTESEYGDVTEYQGTEIDTLPSAGTTLSEIMFDYNSSDNTFSNDTINMATESYYHLVIPVTENGSYQICYKVTTAGEFNYLYAHITDETSSYDGYSRLSEELYSVGTTYTCTDLGYLTEGQGIRIVNITDTTKAAVTFYLQKSTEMTSNGNAGVRYQGKDPNNYVQFNGTELWRIIGVFEGSTIGLEEGKYYTKIIKNESIGNKYWDETNYENNWVNASLNTYLTNTYLPSIETSSSDMIAQDVTYYLGGAPYAAYKTYTPAQFYQAERGNTGGADAPTVVTHQNEIGLMYPSDYGYAMYDGSGKCSTDLGIHNYRTSCLNCANYDWLFPKSYEWTISPRADDSRSAFLATSRGYVDTNPVYIENAVRPVLYLEASVEIESGEGTYASPYILK